MLSELLELGKQSGHNRTIRKDTAGYVRLRKEPADQLMGCEELSLAFLLVAKQVRDSAGKCLMVVGVVARPR